MTHQIIPITNFKTGLNTYDQSENLPDDGFPELNNAHVFRGVIQKRKGYVLLGELAVDITDITQANPGVVTTNTEHGLTTGDQVNLVDVTGMVEVNFSTPITAITNANPGAVTTSVNHGLTTGDVVTLEDVEGMTEVNNESFTVTVTGVTTFTLGVNTTNFGVYITPTGNVIKAPFTVTVLTTTTFEIVDTTSFTAYVSDGRVNILLPVQGLLTRIIVGFLNDLIAFNTTQAFLFNTATNLFDNISGTTKWTGVETDFFWGLNFQQSFWVTNNVDPIRYNIAADVWTDFTPLVDPGGTTLDTALMLFPYKNRMIALLTTESGSQFRQRARFSQNGTVYVTAPVPTGFAIDVDAWNDIPGKGGAIDAPTEQSIITAGFVRDVLVVIFEFSAWRLVYTGNEALPFDWQRLHSQLGAQSTYSVVGFDDGILSIGRAGITITDTNQQKRFDEIIPDQVYQISTEGDAQKRVHGTRDFQRQLVYWTYPSPDSITFPDKVLVYNYVERNWATYTQSFTTFGEFRRVDALIWGAADQEWQEEDSFWASGDIGSGFISVVAGDSQGNVFRLDPTFSSDDGTGYDFTILTKKFNPWIDQALQSKAIYMYLLISGTSGGEITIDHLIDEGNPEIPIASYIVSTDGSGQEKVWRRITLSGATAQYHQFRFTLNAEQSADPDLSVKDIEIYHILLEMAPSGRLNYGITNV
ncbi:hypothetical protein LCGC14_0803860 [marine sediment metagenome]|uniref:Ubiquitin-activating enzyme E1 FCCH domain-containing protein n=1 Tax=marine sediment metagenome TaxID=412755 RepID=A0A0F9PTF6_9ZZZZ